MKILFKPSVVAEAMDIFGEKYARIVSDPNVFVLEDVSTTAEMAEIPTVLNAEEITFSDRNIVYTLKKVTTHKKGNMLFLECKEWKEELK